MTLDYHLSQHLRCDFCATLSLMTLHKIFMSKRHTRISQGRTQKIQLVTPVTCWMETVQTARNLGTSYHRVVRQTLDNYWTENPIVVQALSRPCPLSVQVQGLSVPCQIQLQGLSRPCPKKLWLDRDWTWRSRVCPDYVQQDLWTLSKLIAWT